MGPQNSSTVDYPDYGISLAQVVSEKVVSRGIVICGSGVGASVAANKIQGVRAAVYYNGPNEIIKLSREHNDANILSLGARFMTEDKIYDILEMWFAEPFGGGRHQRRIEKLDH